MKNSIINECLKTARNEISGHPEFSTNGYLHWSFIVQNNKIIGKGKNKIGKSRFTGFGYSPLSKIHSEVDVYCKVKGILNRENFNILNIRLNKLGQLRLSKPCPCCTRFLIFMGCTVVYYTTDNGFLRIRL